MGIYTVITICLPMIQYEANSSKVTEVFGAEFPL